MTGPAQIQDECELVLQQMRGYGNRATTTIARKLGWPTRRAYARLKELQDQGKVEARAMEGRRALFWRVVRGPVAAIAGPLRLVDRERISETLVGLVVRYQGRLSDRALWAVGTQRKDRRCGVCTTDLPSGSKAYRPIGGQLYRHVRLCARCARGEAA